MRHYKSIGLANPNVTLTNEDNTTTLMMSTMEPPKIIPTKSRVPK